MSTSPSTSAAVPPRHLLLALAVVAVWGTNFVVIRAALDVLPPLAFAACRFALAFLPALFVPRPKVKWRSLAGYGLLIGAGQFGLLFLAMDGWISPGLASLVVQSQVFFTIGLAIALSGERVRGYQLGALVLASAGILTILVHNDRAATPLGIALTIAAAISWAGGNQVAKASGTTDMLGFVVWSSAFAVPPLVAAALLVEGAAPIVEAVQRAGPGVWAAVVWQAVGNTLFGYAAWGWLLARHPAATITPSAMLVPVFGMGTSALLLGEPLPGWKLLAAALVLGGLALNLLWPRVSGYPWRRGAAG